MRYVQVSEFLAACWRWARRALHLGAGAERPAAGQHPPAAANPHAESGNARTRFWSEFRAGQREAAARSERQGR